MANFQYQCLYFPAIQELIECKVYSFFAKEDNTQLLITVLT